MLSFVGHVDFESRDHFVCNFASHMVTIKKAVSCFY